MATFRRRPILVEAHRFDPADLRPLQEWLLSHGEMDAAHYFRATLRLDTREGELIARPGDWVVREADGTLYPVEPDAFFANYEPA